MRLGDCHVYVPEIPASIEMFVCLLSVLDRFPSCSFINFESCYPSPHSNWSLGNDIEKMRSFSHCESSLRTMACDGRWQKCYVTKEQLCYWYLGLFLHTAVSKLSYAYNLEKKMSSLNLCFALFRIQRQNLMSWLHFSVAWRYIFFSPLFSYIG